MRSSRARRPERPGRKDNQLLHPDHGWLTFYFPPECANRLGLALVKQSALCEYFAGTLPPSTVTMN